MTHPDPQNPPPVAPPFIASPEAVERPATLPPDFASIPNFLQSLPRWVLWRFERDPDGIWRKASYRRQPTPDKRRTTMSFDDVKRRFEQARRDASSNGTAPYDGIALLVRDGLAAIELHDVFGRSRPNESNSATDPAASQNLHAPTAIANEPAPGSPPLIPSSHHPLIEYREALPWAARLVDEFATYTELSADGRGLTLFLRATLDGPAADDAAGEPIKPAEGPSAESLAADGPAIEPILRAAGPALEPTPHPEGGTIEVHHQAHFICVTGRSWPADQPRQGIQPRTRQYQHLARQLRNGNVAGVVAGVPSLPCASLSAGAPPIEAQEPRNAPKHAETLNTKHETLLSAAAPPIEVQEQEARNAPAHAETLNTKHETLSSNAATPNTKHQTRPAHPFIASPEANPPSLQPSVPPSSAIRPPRLSNQYPNDPLSADELVKFALARFHFGRTPADESFAVQLDGPNIARMFRGGSESFETTLVRLVRRGSHKPLLPPVIARVLKRLQIEAKVAQPVDLPVRIAQLPGDLASPLIPSSHHPLIQHASESAPQTRPAEGIVIDLGTPDGQAVVVTAAGWSVVGRSPVTFRRSPLTRELPIPRRGGNLDLLRPLVNVSDEAWPLLRGWLVAAMFPSIHHPVLLLGGLPGTGKRTALRLLCQLVDPSFAPLRSEPSDSADWIDMAAAGWCIPLDNVSRIQPWFRDALSSAVTGDGLIGRKRYAADLTVLEFRRVIALTSIDPGSLHGTLSDRFLLIEFDPIAGPRRQSEPHLVATFEQLHPQLFGALLDEVVTVLRLLPEVRLERLPRLADFARILAALDLSHVPCATGGASVLPIEEHEQESHNAAGSKARRAPRGVPSAQVPPGANRLTPGASDTASDGELPTQDGDSDGESRLGDGESRRNNASDGPDGDFPNSKIIHTSALAYYFHQIDRLSADALDADSVAQAIADVAQGCGMWEGTAAQLLAMIKPRVLHGLPPTPSHLASKLRRVTSALEGVGVMVSYRRLPSHARTRHICLSTTLAV